ncbi:methylated-DNA--[protein]-cysteine S-methyltransferase [Halostagnicola kamekurae]|uniref:Methylated-DNA-[protein]-cysteine S-methyltransferase n=1 Tax=Halostagnicola kamekurae TaxID=619731 RepID=A0A1I6SN97_9EURY|nr:MGMT family protein [Halostagnicola kamekurae]SFS78422.1 methylated-DNA-[protein]-cysteine S-methyltransferase [Halostagnicola kamekurae]
MEVGILTSIIEIDESFVEGSSEKIRSQVREYERGDRQAFDLEIATPDGILGDVMDAMAEIPYGETRSYGDLASALETSPIAVGQACGRNPVPILVPCHRVVGSDGSLNGYSAADGVATKRRLLEHEAREQKTVQTQLQTDS